MSEQNLEYSCCTVQERKLNKYYFRFNSIILDRDLRDKTMTDTLMYIPNDNTQKLTPSVALNKWLKRLNFQLNKPTNQNSLKLLIKLLIQRIRKRYINLLELTLSPLSLSL